MPKDRSNDELNARILAMLKDRKNEPPTHPLLRDTVAALMQSRYSYYEDVMIPLIIGGRATGELKALHHLILQNDFIITQNKYTNDVLLALVGGQDNEGKFDILLKKMDALIAAVSGGVVPDQVVFFARQFSDLNGSNVVTIPIDAQGVPMAVLQMADDSPGKIFRVKPVTAKGETGKLDGPVTFVSSDPNIMVVSPNDDTSCILTPGPGALDGTGAQVQMSGDADLGAGVRQITGMQDISFVAGETIGFGGGTLEDLPTTPAPVEPPPTV